RKHSALKCVLVTTIGRGAVLLQRAGISLQSRFFGTFGELVEVWWHTRKPLDSDEQAIFSWTNGAKMPFASCLFLAQSAPLARLTLGVTGICGTSNQDCRSKGRHDDRAELSLKRAFAIGSGVRAEQVSILGSRRRPDGSHELQRTIGFG